MPKFLLTLVFAILVITSDSHAQVQMANNDDDLLAVEDFYPTGHVDYSNTKAPSSNSLTEKTLASPASLNKNLTKALKKQTTKTKHFVVRKPASQMIVAPSKNIKNTAPQKITAQKTGGIPNGFRGPNGNIIKSKPLYVVSDNLTGVGHRRPVIVIDPGHGGKDGGTTGKLGTKEKNLTLQYGLALKRELERSGKYKVVMTRSDDRFIELNSRVTLARKAGGDVMISIHADSNPNNTTRGFSVYTLSNRRANSEAKELLAKSDREEVVKGASLRGESRDVKEAIIDFAQGSTKDVSDDFAKTIAKSLGRRIQALKKHNREGSLAVLTGADIPSVLIELGYLSNDYEERLLRREDHKQRIVTSIKSAIDEYFSKFNLVF